MTRRLKFFDWYLFSGVVFLFLAGIMMVYSTGLAGKTESQLWLKQLLAGALGFGGLFFFASLDYRFLRKNGNWLYIFSILLFVGLLFFSRSVRGSSRWFNLGIFNFQPAEFAKFALVIILAKYFQVQGHLLQRFRYVIFSSIYVLIPAAFLLTQPDLGSTLVLLALWLGLVLVSPMPKRFFLYLLVIFLIVSAVSWQFFLAPYQKDRVLSFMNPVADPQGRGYNVLQAMVAIGSGGVTGSGFARGLQSQLKFLPERQTDFIFASTVEELGLVGGGLVVLLFALILWRLIIIIRSSQDLFGTYLAAGVFVLIFTQALVNIGMNLGILPVTGITLPFVSYGGSSLLMMLWLIGVAESVARRSVSLRF